MTVERNIFTQEIVEKWDSFFKEGKPVTTQDIFDLAKNVVALRHYPKSIDGKNEGAELLVKPSIVLDSYETFGPPSITIEGSIIGYNKREKITLEKDKEGNKITIKRLTNVPSKKSILLWAQDLETDAVTGELKLTENQSKLLAERIWHGYKATERWIRISSLERKQENEIFYQDK